MVQRTRDCDIYLFCLRRKVFQTVASRQEVCFAEVPVVHPAHPTGTTVAVMQYGNVRVDVYAGADAATLQAILQAVRAC